MRNTTNQIKRQLKMPGNPAVVNFYTQTVLAKAAIAKAARSEDVRLVQSAGAAYGGLVKRWRRWLVETLTEVAFKDMETSRHLVQAWQKQCFGQSVAATRLKQYATKKRSGGGRTNIEKLPDTEEFKVVYKEYMGALAGIR